jgi:hypothetical protein
MTETRKIKYSSKDLPTVKAFFKSDAFVRGLMGPFGSGKSSACVFEIVRRAQAQAPGADGVRRSRWVVVRNTYPQLRDTTIKTFHDWLPPESFGSWLKSEHRYVIDKLPGVHLEVLFRALDRPDQVRNLLSLEVTGAWVNEAKEVPWTLIEALQGRVGRYPSKRDGGPSWFGVILDTNPPDTDSDWYHYFEEQKPPQAALFRQPSGQSGKAENLIHLPQDYYRNLAAGKSDDYVKVYVEGNYGYVKDGKPVYPEYNDAIHCAKCEPIRGKPIRRGWDFGLTPACSFSQLLPSGQWIVFYELAADQLGADRFSDTVLEQCAQHYAGFTFEDYGDPAGAQRAQTDERSCFDILKAKGIAVQPGEVAESLRIESVKKPLNTLIHGQPGFLLHPRCRLLRKGFLGKYRYRRMQTAAERFTDKPEKNGFSHIHDALQYDASRLFGPGLKGENRGWKTISYPRLGLV